MTSKKFQLVLPLPPVPADIRLRAAHIPRYFGEENEDRVRTALGDLQEAISIVLEIQKEFAKYPPDLYVHDDPLMTSRGVWYGDHKGNLNSEIGFLTPGGGRVQQVKLPPPWELKLSSTSLVGREWRNIADESKFLFIEGKIFNWSPLKKNGKRYIGRWVGNFAGLYGEFFGVSDELPKGDFLSGLYIPNPDSLPEKMRGAHVLLDNTIKPSLGGVWFLPGRPSSARVVGKKQRK